MADISSGCIDGDIGVGTISPGGKLPKNGNQTAFKETHNQSEKASMKFDMSACSARSLQYLSSTSISSASTCVLLSPTPSSCAKGCPASRDIFVMSTALLCSLSTRVTAIYPVSAYYSTSRFLILLCLLKQQSHCQVSSLRRTRET